MTAKINFKTLLLSLVLSSTLISYTLGNPSYEKIILSLLIVPIYIVFKEIKIKRQPILLLAFTLFQILLTFFLYDFPSLRGYSISFFLFSIIFFFILSDKIEFNQLYKYLGIILFICSPIVVLASIYKFDSGMMLGLNYSILPNFVSSIVCLEIAYRDNRIRNIMLFNIVIYSYFFIKFGNRGIFLCLFVYFLIRVIYKPTLKIKQKFVNSLIVIFLSSIFVIYLKQIVSFTVQIFNLFGIQFYALDKMMKLLYENGIDNGRTYIAAKVFQQLDSNFSFLFGRGVGFFEYYTHTYTHNLYLQYLIEGGLFYLIVPIVYTILLIYQIFILTDEMQKFLVLIFVITIVMLNFSLTYWLVSWYWFSIYYIFNITDKSIPTYNLCLNRRILEKSNNIIK